MRLLPFWRWRAPDPSASASERVSSTEDITQQAVAAIADQLDRVLTDVARLGREQFRATTLLEGCDSSLDVLGEAVREHIDQEFHQHAENARLVSELEDQIRVRLVMDLLPVLDALQASIQSARGLIAAERNGSDGPFQRGSHLRQRVERWLGAGRARVSQPDYVAAQEAWLEGLVLVERRLMALFDREGVRTIAAVGEQFDPYHHLAIAVGKGDGVADGTIIAEELRGYTLGDRILRHAEVVVARQTNRPMHQEGVGHAPYRRD